MLTKQVDDISLVLMEYIPAIPVDSAHKYLSKRWTMSQVNQKMQAAAGELLMLIGAICGMRSFVISRRNFV